MGSLGLRANSSFYSFCVCEIRLKISPVQTTQVPFISSPNETNPKLQSIVYLKESGLKKLLLSRGCFYNSSPRLEITIYTGRKGPYCGVGAKRQPVGTFKLDVGPKWAGGKPVVLFNRWIGIAKKETEKLGFELHFRVKLDPDPRYVFRFEDEIKLSPQIVQTRGTVIFSCKFSRDRVSQGIHSAPSVPPPAPTKKTTGGRGKAGNLRYMTSLAPPLLPPSSPPPLFHPTVVIGSQSPACAPGSLSTQTLAGSAAGSWQPWGKLESWREMKGIHVLIYFRFNLFSDGHGCGKLVMSEMSIGADKGSEFSIDTDSSVDSWDVNMV